MTKIAVHISSTGHKKRLVEGSPPPPLQLEPQHSRIAVQVALAHRVNQLLVENEELTFADVARSEGLSRARLTQLMNLTLLAPDIQEQLLKRMQPLVGRDRLNEHRLRRICTEPCWVKQRQMFARVLREVDGEE